MLPQVSCRSQLQKMLFLIGLGLGDEKDITVRGLEAVKSCDTIFLEAYTSILTGVPAEQLEAYYGKKITLADRERVEQGSDVILDAARGEKRAALLVVGDPFGATTHSDLVLRAKEEGIDVQVIHNASIMNAIGASGLQLYNFGPTISMVFFTDTWQPDSFYDKIKANRERGLHTLCLLDIKVKEQTIENLMRGNKIFEPPRFMTVNQCCEQLLLVEEKRKEGAYSADTMCVGIARVGRDDQQFVAGTLSELRGVDFGQPLHSLVMCGELHVVEKEFLDSIAVDKDSIGAAGNAPAGETLT